MYPRGYITVWYPRGIYKPSLITYTVPKWKKGEKEFKVSITYHQRRGCQTYLPRPIVERLGNPKTIRFIVKKKGIEVESGD